MGKGQTKTKTKNPAHHRINFMQQAATFFADLAQGGAQHGQPSTSADNEQSVDSNVTNGKASGYSKNDTNSDFRSESNDGFCPHSSTPSSSAAQGSFLAISAHLVGQARAVAKKSQVKVHPNLKRTWCKVCSTLIQPGIGGAKVRTRKKRLVVTCGNCGEFRRFPLKVGYKLAVEKAENL